MVRNSSSSLLLSATLWCLLLGCRLVWWSGRLATRLLWRFRHELAPGVVAWLLVFCSVGALFGYSSPWLLLPTVLVAIPLYRRSLLRGALSPSARRLRAARAAEQLALSEFAVALDSYGVSTVRGFEEPQYPHVLARRTYEGGSFQWDLELTTGITVDVMRAQSEGFAVSFGASSVTFDRDTLNARKLTMTCSMPIRCPLLRSSRGVSGSPLRRRCPLDIPRPGRS